jgi:adenylate kinase family enzyme
MSDDIPRRIHFTGGPGSGKSWLATRLATALGAPYIDLDGLGLTALRSMTDDGQTDFESLIEVRKADLDNASIGETWVSDGAFIAGADGLLERAGLIVWMDLPWRIASYRIVSRHVKAELRRNNRFPGWKRLYLFWRWSARFYADRNPHGLNVWGTPSTRAFTREVLGRYEAKLVVVRTKRDVEELLKRFLPSP